MHFIKSSILILAGSAIMATAAPTQFRPDANAILRRERDGVDVADGFKRDVVKDKGVDVADGFKRDVETSNSIDVADGFKRDVDTGDGVDVADGF
ncbi:MAG: hypothetical protein Q9201_000641 [Fulgogasparrea decipioides]